MEVSGCSNQLVTFDSLFPRMLSENCYIIHKSGGCQERELTSTPPPMRSRNPCQTS